LVDFASPDRVVGLIYVLRPTIANGLSLPSRPLAGRVTA
jgi:hypothetical protein